jgi:uncharacterized protein
MKRRRNILITVITILLFGCGFLYYQNNAITTTHIHIASKKIPRSFSEYVIVQLSDLHSKSFGDNQKNLVRKVKKQNPNIIVFTGDLIDQKKYDKKAGLTLMEELLKLAPVYYVNGNHEWWSGKYSELKASLKTLGVTLLDNKYKKIKKGQDSIHIIGINDPANVAEADEKKIVREELDTVLQHIEKQDNFQILLSHRPEMFHLYSEYTIDLILAGHAHGGQIRIPFVGGIVAPNQGILPKYTAGKYTIKNSTMIVNRGLGNSIIPQRIFNKPEIIVLKLFPLNSP